MRSPDYGFLFHCAIAATALLSAGFQLLLRYLLSLEMGHRYRRREIVGAVSTALVLTGIAWENAGRPHTQVYDSTVFTAIGVAASLCANWTLWQAIAHA